MRRARRALCGALGLFAGCSSEPVVTALGERAATCVRDEDCDDGLVCSGLERCLDGRCWSGRPPRCEDGDPCTRDLCLEPQGCSHVAMCSVDAALALPDAGAMDAQAPDAGLADASDADATLSDAGSRFAPRLPAYCTASNTILGDVNASVQATLEALAGVQCIHGNLDIGGIAIQTLAPLAALRWVGGDVLVHDAPALETLLGLDALEYVEGTLTIRNLHSAPSLHLLNALQVVESGLVISGLTSTRLAGFSALTRVGGELVIDTPVQDLDSAFGALLSIGAKLRLAGSAITALDTLPALERVAGDLELPKGLIELRGFRRLTSVSGKLVLPSGVAQLAAFEQLESAYELSLESSELASIDGFRALRNVAGELRIGGAKLMRLAGFDSLEMVGRLSLRELPVLRSTSAFRSLTHAGQLSLEETALDTLPFEQLARCNTLALKSNAALRDVAALAHVSGVTSLAVSANPALLRLALSTVAQLQELSITENLTLRELTLSGLDSIAREIQVLANPNLPSCRAELLGAKTVPERRAYNSVCCNQGCARCSDASCSEPGGPAAGQSSHVVSLIPSKHGDLRAYANAESADYVTLRGYEGPVGPLPNLRSITGWLELSDLTPWEDLSPLLGVETIGGDLRVYAVQSLTSLAGLSALRSVGGMLKIEHAPKLRELALPALESVVGGADLWGVPALGFCEVERLRLQVAAPETGPGAFSAAVAACAGSCAGSVCQ